MPDPVIGEHWKGIGKLTEEAGEVLQLLGKAIAFPVGEHPDGHGPLKVRLEDELGDLLASILYFAAANGLDLPKIERRNEVKLSKFIEWGLSGVHEIPEHGPDNGHQNPNVGGKGPDGIPLISEGA